MKTETILKSTLALFLAVSFSACGKTETKKETESYHSADESKEKIETKTEEIQKEITIEEENEPVDVMTEQPATEPEQPAQSSGIRPEFQQAMDDYLAFFTEYCEFMNAFSNSENGLTLLAQYADFMTRYTETMNSLEAIDESQLSNEELALYIDTSAQIQKMLLEVA